MTRQIRATGVVSLLFSFVAFFASQTGVAVAQNPSITVVLPSTEEFYKDLKYTFDLAKDPKGFETLKSTLDLFLVGVDPAERSGLRVYSTAAGFQYVGTLPIEADPLKFDPTGKKWPAAAIKAKWPKLATMSDEEKQKLRAAELAKLKPDDIKNIRNAGFAELISNLWDLDVKTYPAPDPKLTPRIPKAVVTRGNALNPKLAKEERLIFGLTDGFLRYESGHVHIGKQLVDIRLAKGGLPPALVKGHDLAVFVDGNSQKKEDRQAAFDKVKPELLESITKGAKEDEAAFEIRKSITEHQIAEVERFFVESSQIKIGWNTSITERHSRIEIELDPIADTDLAKSVALLGEGTDEFTGVSKTDTIFHLSGNFALDPMRAAFLTKWAKQCRTLAKKRIAEGTDLSDEEKKTDDALVDVLFDVVDGFPGLGFINGAIRSWSNDDGTVTSLIGGRIPDDSRPKFEKILADVGKRKADNKVEMKVDTEGDVEIHKLSVPGMKKEHPELIGKDGEVFVVITDKIVWLATGDKSLDRLKTAIKEVKETGPKPAGAIDMFLTFGPYVEILDKYHGRNTKVAAVPVAAPKKADDPKKGGGAKPAEKKVEGLFSGPDLLKVALETFKAGKDRRDTMTVKLDRDKETAKLHVQFEESLIQFVGKVMSKFVKENLEDE